MTPRRSPELYGLVSQLRRAAVSIPANIAEGFTRQGRADKARMLNLAIEVSRILEAYVKGALSPVSWLPSPFF